MPPQGPLGHSSGCNDTESLAGCSEGALALPPLLPRVTGQMARGTGPGDHEASTGPRPELAAGAQEAGNEVHLREEAADEGHGPQAAPPEGVLWEAEARPDCTLKAWDHGTQVARGQCVSFHPSPQRADTADGPRTRSTGPQG